MASGGAVAWTWGCAHVQADGDTLTQELVQMSWASEPLAMASRCTGRAGHAAWAQASPASADRPRHPREPTPWEGPGCGLAGRVAVLTGVIGGGRVPSLGERILGDHLGLMPPLLLQGP